MNAQDLEERFSDLYKGSKENLDQSESKLKSRFHKSEILEGLGYEEDDIKVEKSDARGKRTDIHCTDEYGNVSFIVEFKRPTVEVGKSKHKKQLVDRYMKPLKADFGILYNGLKVVAYRREGLNSEHLFTKRTDDLGDKAKQVIKFAEKPDYSLTKIDNVSDYFNKFNVQEEKLKLEQESAREHFFENFKLEKNSSFENLLISTIDLFKEMKGENQFLDSAFRFWKESYAKKPDEVPDSWQTIMDRSKLSGESDLYQFMFCLETSYAVFARLIMAKSGEDYGFSEARFSDFIETEVRRASDQDDIALGSWAKVTQDLIDRMRRKMVSSVFEEDIFYWWTEPYEDRAHKELFQIKRIPNEVAQFGKSLGKITLMIYKFNFSKIAGDPLGVLYQQYFDKETRKALGEFYTPEEVVDYILDSVDYGGRQVLDKRLLDPACGSGTFPVSALKEYLNAAKSSGRAEEEGWDTILDELCNQYRIVGFDIHPFATIMAQIQFMLVLMPYYKKAREDAKQRGDRFKLQRIPIFRTDSLKDESKSSNEEDNGNNTLIKYDEGKKFKMEVKLPVNKEEGGDFFDEEFAMPTPQAARKVGLHNNQEYFGALQAFFDAIKEQASEMEDKDEVPEFNRQRFEDHLRKYSLTDKKWNQISTLFQSFADNLLIQINRLQTEFDDGRLIKSIEDIYLAALLKNEQKYDYIAENPPYVRIHGLSDDQKDYYKENYMTAHGQYDLYVLFMERSIELLNEGGKMGLIVSSKFTSSDYGKKLRKFILDETKVLETIDVSSLDVFQDASIYPFIGVFEREPSEEKRRSNEIKTVIKPTEQEFKSYKMDSYFIPQSRYLENKDWLFDLLPEEEFGVIEKLNRNSVDLGEIVDITRGFRPPPDNLVEETNSEDRKPYIRGDEMTGPYEIEQPTKFVEYNREEIAEDKPPEVFEQPKVMVRDIGLSASSYYDEDGIYCLKTIYLIENLQDENWDLEVLTGLLNSKTTDFFFRANFWSSHIGGGYLRFRKQYLTQIPTPRNPQEDLLSDLKKKIRKVESVKEKERKISAFPKLRLEDIEISKKTLKCNSGHPDMEPSIQTTQDGMFEVEVGKRKTDSILLDTEEKARFVKKALEGDSAGKEDEVEILVPRSNFDVKEILQDYEDDKEKLEEMPSVEELEEEINELVYDLYDLDEEEIGVIEDFLEKF